MVRVTGKKWVFLTEQFAVATFVLDKSLRLRSAARSKGGSYFTQAEQVACPSCGMIRMFIIGDMMSHKDALDVGSCPCHSPRQLQVVFLPCTASVALGSVQSPQGFALISVPNLLSILCSLSNTHRHGRPWGWGTLLQLGPPHRAPRATPHSAQHHHQSQAFTLPNLLSQNDSIPFPAQNYVCASTVVSLKALSDTSMEMMVSRAKFSGTTPKATLNSPGKAQRGTNFFFKQSSLPLLQCWQVQTGYRLEVQCCSLSSVAVDRV